MGASSRHRPRMLSPNRDAAVVRLEQTIQRTREFAATLKSGPGAIVLHQVLARQLYWATESAEMILDAVRGGRPFGAQAQFRHLMEILTEVLLVVTSPNAERAAVEVLVWDLLLGWEDDWAEYKKALGRAPAPLFAGREKTQTLKQAIEDQRSKLVTWGGDVDLFDNVSGRMQDRRQTKGRLPHWTGEQSFEARVEVLLRRVPEEEKETKEKLIWMQYFWKRGSYNAHASPRFRLIQFRQHKDGRYEPAPIPNLDDKLRGTADGAADFLDDIRNIVAQAYRPVAD